MNCKRLPSSTTALLLAVHTRHQRLMVTLLERYAHDTTKCDVIGKMGTSQRKKMSFPSIVLLNHRNIGVILEI